MPTSYKALTRGDKDYGYEISDKITSTIPLSIITSIQQRVKEHGSMMCVVRGELIIKNTVDITGYASRRNYVIGKIAAQ